MKKIFLIGIFLTVLTIIGLTGCTTPAITTATNTTTTTEPLTTTTILNTYSPDVIAPKESSVDGVTYSGTFTEQQSGIWVTGTGIVTVVPDVANLNLGVQSQETTVAAAQAKAATAMNQIMAVLKTNNIADKDIQTIQFNINPVYSYDKSTMQNIVVGYSVSNIVNVKIRNLNNVGKIIDAVADAGGDLTVINGISFAVDNPSQYYVQAREKAMNDAKAKAQQLATLGGVTLGKPIYVTESSVTPTPIYYVKGVSAPDSAQSTPVSAGETDIMINVTVNYSVN